MKISLIFLLVLVFSGCMVSAEPFFHGFRQAFGKVIGVMGGLASNIVDGFKTTVNGWRHTLGFDGDSNAERPESKPEQKLDSKEPESKPDSKEPESKAPETILGNSTDAKLPSANTTTTAPSSE